VNFDHLEAELISLVEDEKNLVANLSNVAASIYHSFPGLNWCGFYLWSEEDQELVLGPFQGKPACIRIKPGKGVCGTSYLKREALRVDDVHAFPGHIACDSASESELVVPLIKDGIVRGVLDLDAPIKSHFSEEDAQAFSRIMNKVVPYIWR
jgi:L-methionine (R)-S-oxide reductase